MASESRTGQGSLTDEFRRGGEEVRRLGGTVGEISNELRVLAQRELDLARAEMADQASLATRAGIWGAVAAVFGILVLVFLGLTLMFALAEALALWASALLTALVIGVVAAIAGYVAMQRAKQMTIVPRRTMNSIGKDVQWAREQMLQNARSRSNAA